MFTNTLRFKLVILEKLYKNIIVDIWVVETAILSMELEI